MQCSDFTFPRSSPHLFIPPSPSTAGRRPIPGHRPLISIRNTPPYTSPLSIKTTASGIADGSFYDLLGVSESGSMAEIKRAYKKLALKYHPDVSPSPPCRAEEHTEMFIRVREAYETISDPTRRALYDRDVVRRLKIAFSARRRSDAVQGIPEKSEWKNCWEYQILELKRRSVDKASRHNLSNLCWGARMRRQMHGYV